MKALKTNLPKHSDNTAISWDEEDLVENHNPRLNGKKMERKRPVQNWKKIWSEHVEDYDEVDEFYEH